MASGILCEATAAIDDGNDLAGLEQSAGVCRSPIGVRRPTRSPDPATAVREILGTPCQSITWKACPSEPPTSTEVPVRSKWQGKNLVRGAIGRCIEGSGQ